MLPERKPPGVLEWKMSIFRPSKEEDPLFLSNRKFVDARREKIERISRDIVVSLVANCR